MIHFTVISICLIELINSNFEILGAKLLENRVVISRTIFFDKQGGLMVKNKAFLEELRSMIDFTKRKMHVL